MFSKLLTATVLTAVFASTVTASIPPDCDRSYEIQVGDTCDSVFAKNPVSDYQFHLINPGVNCSNMHPGEIICFGRKGQDCRDLHTVSSTESCLKIAHDAGISVKLLIQNNPNIGEDCHRTRVGEVLCIADKVIPYTPNPPPNH